MKNTALTDKHIELGAKMVPFAGYNMPVQYTGVNQEHAHVRSAVGVFDVSHMGEFYIKGVEAEQLVQKVTSNDVSQLFDGKIQYSCLPNGKGGIVDDLLVYRISSEEFLLVVNASNIDKDWDWISSHNTFKATMENKSDSISLLAVQGPKATESLQGLTDVNLAEMEYYTFKIGTFAGIDNVIISATGYTGAGGFEIYFPNENANAIWDGVFKAGASNDILPIGLAARDTLRLEMGFCLYGNDIDDTTSPLEAGLGWITKLNKGDFIDREYLVNQKETGITRRLAAFEMVDKGIPRHGYPIVDSEGNEIGVVTSGTMSPSLKKAVGLGYINVPTNKVGNDIFISIRNKSLKASVVKLPFYKG
ncbi:MAG: glycine cleavage system aminomethyltransferase GcvT [Salibacteraceae bacterium]|nr:glycine cleavage system aminomethyltransferase GcvT [Salibacteraceae bacterium]|tara:strand:- start:36440 stop:37525 length:1086 start_codon:yes stop_codon:yes gene_type:complete